MFKYTPTLFYSRYQCICSAPTQPTTVKCTSAVWPISTARNRTRERTSRMSRQRRSTLTSDSVSPLRSPSLQLLAPKLLSRKLFRVFSARTVDCLPQLLGAQGTGAALGRAESSSITLENDGSCVDNVEICFHRSSSSVDMETIVNRHTSVACLAHLCSPPQTPPQAVPGAAETR